MQFKIELTGDETLRVTENGSLATFLQSIKSNTKPEQVEEVVPVEVPKEQTKKENVKQEEPKKTVSVDELAQAAHSLIGKEGGQQKLIELLGSFGVNSLPELTEEQRTDFAEKLKGLN